MVFIALLLTLITGIVLYVLYSGPDPTAVALLAGSALVAFVFAVLAIKVTMSYRTSRQRELEYHVPPSRFLRALELRQWLILTLGVAFLSVATGAATALRGVNDDQLPQARPTVSAAPVEVPVQVTTDPLPEPTTAEPTTAGPTTSPSDGFEVLDPSGSPSDMPVTKYLDSEDTLAGGYDAQPVTFAAQRYLRGIAFYCYKVTSSRLQWNVAGYREFTAVGGIDDNTEGAFGAVVEFIFYDQDGRQLVPKSVEVSVGRAHKITIDLSGVVSLRMTCASRDVKTGEPRSTRSAFGDPVVTR